ncbi:putative secreted protein, SVM family protein [Candidatus Phytoplasma solani]|uniref:SVM family protein n=1 Tax=Candidatus Phytoplasma solani TaxID=69896 RepID=UPI0032DAE71E
MFKVKKQLFLFKIVLLVCLGLFLITNIHQVMAMDNYNLNDQNAINNKIYQLSLKKENLSKKILHCDKLNLNTMNLKQQLKILDQTIEKLYQRLSVINTLKYINEKIWRYSYERNQVAIKILSRTYQDTTIEELNNKYQEIIQKINNLREKYINLQYKLNEFH